VGNLTKNIVGMTFYRWEVVAEEPERGKNGDKLFKCICQCGVINSLRSGDLTKGKSRSCGCLRKEILTTHGASRTPEYSIWNSAKKRAKNKNLNFDIQIEDIKIPTECPILGVKLEYGGGDNGPSLDRIDPNGGYTVDNIWVISAKANRIKNDATAEELQLVADAVKEVTRT